MTGDDVIHFWFDEIEPESWFKKSDDFDALIKDRFAEVHQAVVRGEKFQWRETITGRLAEIIVTDQFSRNMFRDEPRSFAYVGIALVLAQEAVKLKERQFLTLAERRFLYFPFMHSESLYIHEVARPLFTEEGLEEVLDYENQHVAILERFGRYPHRNKALGRQSTPEELAFLKEPNSSF